MPIMSRPIDVERAATRGMSVIVWWASKNHWGMVQRMTAPSYRAESKGDAKKGAQLFDLACSACHGDNGKGGGKGNGHGKGH